MYEGTKHSTATRLKALGADDRVLAALAGHRDTVWIYEVLTSYARSARSEARTVFITKDVGERAAAVRRVLNQLGPYYDPDFQTLAPLPSSEPGATR